jgi:geranylgeranyl reductase family protein
MHVDVAVVGAGPAGAAAALRARQLAPGARVLLLDKAGFPRDKACGDAIAPHAIADLAALGVPGAMRGYPPVPWLRITAPDGTRIAAAAPRANFVVPRLVFDDRLVGAARAAGVCVERMAVRTLVDRGGDVVLNGEIAARTVIAADGANSRVRRVLGAAPNPPDALAIAVRGYADAPPGPLEQRIALVADGWPAYAWSFPIGDGRANVGFGLLRARMPRRRSDLADRLAGVLPGQVPDPASLRAHHLPLSTRRPAPAQGRVLLAGDAASLVNPLTGEGIVYAIASGALAGAAAVAYPEAPAAAYAAALGRRFGRHLRSTGLAARLTRHPPVVTAALRAASASPRTWEALVELGLADGTLSAGTLRDILWRSLVKNQAGYS